MTSKRRPFSAIRLMGQCVLLVSFLLLISDPAWSFSRMATPPLARRVEGAETVFVGKLINRTEEGEWAQAELLVVEPLKNARKGDTVQVIWRMRLGQMRIYDARKGQQGIAILGDKHKGRYWLRADKFEPLAHLGAVKTILGGAEEKGGSGSDAAAVAAGNNAFALNLYSELRTKDGNLFFSPYSISSALAMTCSGAKGDTATQMKGALAFPGEQDALPAAFKLLDAELHANAEQSGQKLTIANGLCLVGGSLRDTYKALLKESYGAEVFRGDLSEINGWVKRKTEEKIPTILNALPANTVCVILNAIYFKGQWDSEFDKEQTQEQPFHVSDAETAKVPLMVQKSKYRVVHKDGFRMASLPYKGKELSMVVLLPGTIDGLAALEAKMTPDALNGWLTELDKQPEKEVHLYLPRFTLATKYELSQSFKQMGMKDAFGPGADFSGMGGKPGDIWIGGIVHKAFCDVNEEGTEAAAATAVVMRSKSLGPPTPVFRADHPFVYLIRDDSTGTILFMGRLVRPGE